MTKFTGTFVLTILVVDRTGVHERVFFSHVFERTTSPWEDVFRSSPSLVSPYRVLIISWSSDPTALILRKDELIRCRASGSADCTLVWARSIAAVKALLKLNCLCNLSVSLVFNSATTFSWKTTAKMPMVSSKAKIITRNPMNWKRNRLADDSLDRRATYNYK